MASDDRALPLPVRGYVELRFPDPPPLRPYVILNMVCSADGKAAVAGTEAPLSSPLDKLTLQSLRVHADAILNGAGTARTTGVNPKIRDPRLAAWRRRLGRDKSPLQVVLTETANLPAGARFLRRREFSLIIAVGQSAPPERVADLAATGALIEVLPAGSAALPELLRRLRLLHGVNLLLLEGGPTLNAAFFHAGLIDEFFLTLGPHVVAGAGEPTTVEGEPFQPGTMPGLELVSCLPSPTTSEVYIHWRVRK